MSVEEQVLQELSGIRTAIADVRERLVQLEARRSAESETAAAISAAAADASKATTTKIDNLDIRVRALEIAGASVGQRLATVTGVGGLVVGAAIAYLARVVFGG